MACLVAEKSPQSLSFNNYIGVQLALNHTRSLIFFVAKSIGWAAIDLMILWTAIVVNFCLFWKIDGLAGSLLIPYLFWTSFALALNISNYVLN
jgi:tryptophan-rich sensory protein